VYSQGRPIRFGPDSLTSARALTVERPGVRVVYGVKVLEKMLEGPPPRVDPQAVAKPPPPKSSPM
jgi:hypothetical protein